MQQLFLVIELRQGRIGPAEDAQAAAGPFQFQLGPLALGNVPEIDRQTLAGRINVVFEPFIQMRKVALRKLRKKSLDGH